MKQHSGRIEFQFTKREVEEADFRRFNTLLGKLGEIPLPEGATILQQLCGSLSMRFDSELRLKSECALEHPAFHNFAKRLFENSPALPFLINLEDSSFWLLFLGSLERLTKVDVHGTSELRWGFDKTEFCDRGERCKRQVMEWSEKAGMSREAAIQRRRDVEGYLLDVDTAHKLAW